MKLRPRWLDEADESLARKLALLPLDLAGIGYGLGAALHRAVYERGLRPRTQLGCRVISVGSLVVGGAGKTPVAAWLARALHERGHRVVIASRGYGRRGVRRGRAWARPAPAPRARARPATWARRRRSRQHCR